MMEVISIFTLIVFAAHVSEKTRSPLLDNSDFDKVIVLARKVSIKSFDKSIGTVIISSAFTEMEALVNNFGPVGTDAQPETSIAIAAAVMIFFTLIFLIRSI